MDYSSSQMIVTVLIFANMLTQDANISSWKMQVCWLWSLITLIQLYIIIIVELECRGWPTLWRWVGQKMHMWFLDTRSFENLKWIRWWNRAYSSEWSRNHHCQSSFHVLWSDHECIKLLGDIQWSKIPQLLDDLMKNIVGDMELFEIMYAPGQGLHKKSVRSLQLQIKMACFSTWGNHGIDLSLNQVHCFNALERRQSRPGARWGRLFLH